MAEAATSTPVAPPEQLLRQLEFTVIRKLDGLLQGDYRTLWRGAGVDLADLREYQSHDDVRHIDWNVTARLQTPYVRQYLEDRDLNAWFLLDLSSSVDFGSADVTKLAVSTGFVATLARVITRHGNRVGALFYGSPVSAGPPRAGVSLSGDGSRAAPAAGPRVFGMLPARASRLHVLELLQRMRSPQLKPKAGSHGGTALAELLHAAESTIKRRGLVFVVSDFISEPGWLPALSRLARRHDVVAVRLWDPLEMALPDVGLVTLEDAETGEQLFVDASDPDFRERYATLAEAHEAALLQSLAASGADVLELATDDDLLDTLMRFTDLRKQRERLKAPLRFPSTLRRAALMAEAAP